ncbi:MAG TPA: hypothetical protein VIT92_03220 [Burkholderiaceae bacterium]
MESEQRTGSDREQLQAAGARGHDPSRRRFGRAGLGASGVLLTLACKPVLGAVAVAPSGFCSANQSRHGTAEQNVSFARNPDYWRDSGQWPIPKETTFSQVFAAGTSSPYAGVAIEQIVAGHPDDYDHLAQYLTTALLNVRAGWANFLNEATVLAMYNELHTKGYFEPSAGVQWAATDIVHYLKSVQT